MGTDQVSSGEQKAVVLGTSKCVVVGTAQVSLWDSRSRGAGGCVERLAAASCASPFYCVTCDSSGTLIGAGA